MKIVFVHPHKAFLPGITAYTEFFSRHSVECLTATADSFRGMERDVEWFFLGMDSTPRFPGIIRIHEYQSVSLPPFSHLKDFLKRHFSTQPDFRIYQNSFVKERLGFRDQLPFGFRLPCLSQSWNEPISPREKKFDFIYVGDVSSQRKMEQLLNHFCGPMKAHSLLILSKMYDRLQKKYAHASNIFFQGPVAREEVRARIIESRFAINFMPDAEPFSKQVSTKLLEYASCEIPIITTDYAWIREFERQQGGRYFFLLPDLRNFRWEDITSFSYSFPRLNDYRCDQQIHQSGVLRLLQDRFPAQQF